jgi:hypothetical protein
VTTINGGPATNRFVTTYFRKAFTVDDPSIYRSLLLRLKRDDGANVFLNGAEIFRSNMPTGAITFSTPATLDVSGAAEDAFFPADVSTALQRLVPGQNTLAVELHQVSPSSSDASFDLELCANAVRNNFPPVLRFAGLNAALAYQVGQPIGFNVDALDPDDNVSLVEFFVDGISRQRDTAAPFTFVLSNAPPGGHLLMAMATDSMGNSSSEAVSVTVVSNLAPTVVIAAPAEMTEFKTGDAITATAIASDEAGEVALVQFYLREGHDFGAPNLPVGSDNAAPYTADLGALAPGIYFLTAVARDNLGAESPSVPVEFVVTAPVVMTITQNGNTITICWPETAHDYQVEETPELTKPIPWTPVNATVVMEHEMHCVTLQVGNGTRFFRLSRMTMP